MNDENCDADNAMILEEVIPGIANGLIALICRVVRIVISDVDRNGVWSDVKLYISAVVNDENCDADSAMILEEVIPGIANGLIALICRVVRIVISDVDRNGVWSDVKLYISAVVNDENCDADSAMILEEVIPGIANGLIALICRVVRIVISDVDRNGVWSDVKLYISAVVNDENCDVDNAMILEDVIPDIANGLKALICRVVRIVISVVVKPCMANRVNAFI